MRKITCDDLNLYQNLQSQRACVVGRFLCVMMKTNDVVFQASLKVEESEWSDKFSLDTVGSAGTVSCKLKTSNIEVSRA